MSSCLGPALCAPQLNFAREIACITCMREVDDTTEYLDSSDYQKQRHRGMLKLAQRLEPSMVNRSRIEPES